MADTIQLTNLHPYIPPYNVESFEMMMYWETIDFIDNLEIALTLASSYCRIGPCEPVHMAQRDERIRIVDGNNKII